MKNSFAPSRNLKSQSKFESKNNPILFNKIYFFRKDILIVKYKHKRQLSKGATRIILCVTSKAIIQNSYIVTIFHTIPFPSFRPSFFSFTPSLSLYK